MHKRLYRQASPEAKTKMSTAHKGRTPSELTKQCISQGLKQYWKTVPSKEEYTTMNQLLGIRDEKRGASCIDKNIIKLTEAQLQEIVRRVLLEVLNDGELLEEMAEPRGVFVEKCNNYMDVVFVHIAKICIARSLHFSEETISHWKAEIATALENVLGKGIVGDNSGRIRKKAFKTEFVDKALGYNYSAISESMLDYFRIAMEDEGFSEDDIRKYNTPELVSGCLVPIRELLNSIIECAGYKNKEDLKQGISTYVFNF